MVAFFCPPPFMAAYDPASLALFGAMTNQPSSARKLLIDTTIKALKSSGLWAKLDLFYMLAAHDSQAARLNWVSPGNNTLSVVGAPAFSADHGYTGNGSSHYLDTGFNVSSAPGRKFSQNDAHMAVSIGTNVNANMLDIGLSNSLNVFISSLRLTSTVRSRFLQASTNYDASLPSNTSVGHTLVSRTASGNYKSFRDGAVLATHSSTSAAPPDATVVLMQGNNSAYSSRQIRHASVGGGLSDGEASSLSAIVGSYLAGL